MWRITMASTLIRTSIVLLILFLTLSIAHASDPQQKFCDGYKSGYLIGYKKSTGFNIKPIVPSCPLQPIKTFNTPQDDYEFGFLEGLRLGLNQGNHKL